MIPVLFLLLADAIRLNTILMKYVTGELSNPVHTYNPEETTQYLDINFGVYEWDALIDFAAMDGRLTEEEKTFMNVMKLQIQYVDTFPPVVPGN